MSTLRTIRRISTSAQHSFVFTMNPATSDNPRTTSRLLAALDAALRGEVPLSPPALPDSHSQGPNLNGVHHAAKSLPDKSNGGGKVARTRSSPARTLADPRPYVFRSFSQSSPTRTFLSEPPLRAPNPHPPLSPPKLMLGPRPRPGLCTRSPPARRPLPNARHLKLLAQSQTTSTPLNPLFLDSQPTPTPTPPSALA
jgi:hypothetical protein